MESTIQAELFDAANEPDMQLMQAHLKSLLTEVFLDERPVPRLLAITALVPPHCRPAWQLVSHTLLARRLGAAAGSPTGSAVGSEAGPGEGGTAGSTRAAAPGRSAGDVRSRLAQLQAQWQQPVLAQRWERLVSQLTPPQGLALVRRARRRGLVH